MKQGGRPEAHPPPIPAPLWLVCPLSQGILMGAEADKEERMEDEEEEWKQEKGRRLD